MELALVSFLLLAGVCSGTNVPLPVGCHDIKPGAGTNRIPDWNRFVKNLNTMEHQRVVFPEIPKLKGLYEALIPFVYDVENLPPAVESMYDVCHAHFQQTLLWIDQVANVINTFNETFAPYWMPDSITPTRLFMAAAKEMIPPAIPQLERVCSTAYKPVDESRLACAEAAEAANKIGVRLAGREHSDKAGIPKALYDAKRDLAAAKQKNNQTGIRYYGDTVTWLDKSLHLLEKGGWVGEIYTVHRVNIDVQAWIQYVSSLDKTICDLPAKFTTAMEWVKKDRPEPAKTTMLVAYSWVEYPLMPKFQNFRATICPMHSANK